MKTRSTLRFVRRWFIELRPDMRGGSAVIGGRPHRVKTFKLILQEQTEDGEWQDIPTVDDEASLAEVRKQHG